jgi:uncharacterized protein YxeA
MKTSNIILFTGLTLFIVAIAFILIYIRHSFFIDEEAVHITGSGVAVEIVQELDSFERVRVAGNIPVYLHKGERERVRFKMDSNLTGIVKAEVNNGRLNIYTKGIVSSEILEAHLYFVELKSVEAYSGASIYNQDAFEEEKEINFEN